jgi:hypothetical protein
MTTSVILVALSKDYADGGKAGRTDGRAEGKTTRRNYKEGRKGGKKEGRKNYEEGRREGREDGRTEGDEHLGHFGRVSRSRSQTGFRHFPKLQEPLQGRNGRKDGMCKEGM